VFLSPRRGPSLGRVEDVVDARRRLKSLFV